MIFTGSNLTIKRNFYTQTGNFGFGLACTVDNSTGLYKFGLTGAQGVLEFQLNSGRMYYQNQFIHAYRPNEEFLIEAQFTSGTSNVIRNGSPLIYGEPKASGNFDYFYFSRENDGMGADFDLQISGSSIPAYTVATTALLLNTGQLAVTGWFLNQSQYALNVFDSDMQASQNYDFAKLNRSIPSGASGFFAFSGDYSTFDVTDPILTTFNTSYNDISILFTIINATVLDTFIQITAPTDFTFNTTGILNRTLSYLSYSGGIAGADFPSVFSFSLGYVSGSGIFSLSGAGFSGLVYGSFVESGLMTGLVVSTTGNFIGSTSGWATGLVTGLFSGIGSGLASGVGYTGVGTGYFTGMSTGIIFDGSGKLQLGYPTIGLPVQNSIFSLGIPSYATGQLVSTGFSLNNTNYIVGWDTGFTTGNPLFTFIPGSGSPAFTRSGPPGARRGTIAFESGEDILYGMSGMDSYFGITGYTTGKYSQVPWVLRLIPVRLDYP
jgi:hypothetical protein